MGKITGLEEVRQVPPKVRQMYMAVLQMLEEGADAAGISVSSITERAGIGKGTAYEYFDMKDEIIACAIVYEMQCFFGWLKNSLEERDSFRERLDFLLDQVEKKDVRLHCFQRFIQMMADNGRLHQMVREKMEEEAFAPFRPKNIFGSILRQGMEQGELRGDVPLDYLVYCLFSHLTVYMMLNGDATGDAGFREGAAEMRPLVRRGILDALEKGDRAEGGG